MVERESRERTIRELAELADRLKNNLDELKRPLVIEFSGTPKAGKTTCVEAISKFLRRHGIPVHIVTERASVCPILDKHHLFYNLWTGLTSLAQMLEALERRVSVVTLDRGLFDSLVWIDFLGMRHAVSPTELSTIEDFLLLDRFVSRIDIVATLSVEPHASLQREFRDQITDIEGSIMNLDNLLEYNRSLDRCRDKYESRFRRILSIDTTDREPVEGVRAIASEVLSAADVLVDEPVAVVERGFVSTRMPDSGVLAHEDETASFLDELVDQMKWVRRTLAEEDTFLVQIVPVAMIRRKEEILVMTIRGEKQGSLVNRRSIWAGGHTRRGDLPKRGHRKTVFRRSLVRELDEELNIHLDIDKVPLLPEAILWDNTEPRSLQHLGLLFEYAVPASMPKEVLHMREFWESPTKSLFTRFHPLDQELGSIPDWETWSVRYLSRVYNVGFPERTKQTVLF